MSNSNEGRNELALAILRTAAVMKKRGLTDEEMAARLAKSGLPKDSAEIAVHELPRYFARTGGQVQWPGPPAVFLSHSHRDREVASYLETILRQNSANTFLDQHNVEPGEDLKNRLKIGIVASDKLILFWSINASRSSFVQWEWQFARNLMKDIIPYALDATPLPDELSSLVHIDRSDQSHGHAGLLRAVFGRKWKPKQDKLFPGLWRAEFSIPGVLDAEYELELRANGQITGEGHAKQTGLLGQLGASMGTANILGMKVPMTGTWSYDDRQKVLTLHTTASMAGRSQQDVITIRMTGNEKGWVEGQSMGGYPWRLRRVR